MWPLYFVLILISFQNVLGFRKEYCYLEDSVCMIEALHQHAYTEFVAGLPCDVESLDPLRLETTEVCLPNGAYTIRDGILRGINDCEFQKLKVRYKNGYYYFTSELLCPSLTLQTNNEVNSKDCTKPEKGFQCETTYHDYYLNFNGTFKIAVNTHYKAVIHVTSYSFDSVLQGEVTYECKSLTKPECINKYYSKLEKLARSTVMDKVQNSYMENLTIYLTIVPVEEIYFRYVPEKCC